SSMQLLRVFYWSAGSLVAFFLAWILQPLEWHNLHDTESLITRWGYPFESHIVRTEDGYILEIQRIKHGRNAPDPAHHRPPVLLQHGLALDSSNYVANLPNQSLAFLLADAGFDVWLGNSRGNSYGRKHESLHHWDFEFWNFSWQEMANHDVPAIVDKVLEVTGEQRLNYIGHSQGALILFARLTEDEELTKKIHNVFALAPALSVTNIRGPIAGIAPLAPILQQIEQLAGGSFGVFRRSIVNTIIGQVLCNNDYLSTACARYFYANGGIESKQLNTSRMDVYLSSYPDGMSTKNVVHFGQMVLHKRTARFDYGADENLARYGCRIAPAYNFTNVKVPMYIWYSPQDYLVSDVDIQEMIIPTLDSQYLKLNKSLPSYNHVDFHWGLNAVADIYEPIIEILTSETKIR
ncbi:hypothetical protein PMAYCL1PPCAC_07974, partial [Pristionchus mayeri]